MLPEAQDASPDLRMMPNYGLPLKSPAGSLWSALRLRPRSPARDARHTVAGMNPPEKRYDYRKQIRGLLAAYAMLTGGGLPPTRC